MELYFRDIDSGKGNFICLGCEDRLIGDYHIIGKRKEHDGGEWRRFCKKCWSSLENKSDNEIYKTHRASYWMS